LTSSFLSNIYFSFYDYYLKERTDKKKLGHFVYYVLAYSFCLVLSVFQVRSKYMFIYKFVSASGVVYYDLQTPQLCSKYYSFTPRFFLSLFVRILLRLSFFSCCYASKDLFIPLAKERKEIKKYTSASVLCSNKVRTFRWKITLRATQHEATSSNDTCFMLYVYIYIYTYTIHFAYCTNYNEYRFRRWEHSVHFYEGTFFFYFDHRFLKRNYRIGVVTYIFN